VKKKEKRDMDIDKSISDGLTISIPDQLRTSEFGFIRLGKRSKEPVDKAWQFLARDTRWNDTVIQDWIRNGGNYGVVPLSGDVCILDCDDESLTDAILDAGVTTFSVTTGSGGKHYYFRCSGLGDKKIVIYDENDNHLGEVYPAGCKAYCVGPNCIHPNGNSYVPDDYDVVRFDNFKNDILPKFKSNFNQKLEECIPKSAHFLTNKLTEQLGLKIEEIGYPTGKVTKNGDEIQGSHPIHGSTTGKNYSINTRKNLFYCFRDDFGGDPITFLAMKHGLIKCGDTTPINSDIFVELKDILADKYGYKEELKVIDKERKKKDIPVMDFDEVDAICQKRAEGRIYEPQLCDDHFVIRYADTICEMTDSYRDYQYGSALMLLSMVVQRKAYFNATHGEIFPNIWMFYLGTSSYSKKSTSIRFARAFAEGLIGERELANNITPERIIQDIAEHKCVYQMVDEAAGLLDSMKKKTFMSEYRDMMCKLYDNEPYKSSRSKRRGRPKKGETDAETNDWAVRDSYTNILMATTPDGFTETTGKTDLSTGFFYRFLFIYPRYTKALMVTSERTQEQVKAIKDIGDRLSKIHQYFNSNPVPEAKLKFRFDEDALSYWNKYEVKTIQENHKSEKTECESIFARMGVSAQKLMQLIEIGSPEFYQWIYGKGFQLDMGDEYLIRLETVKEVCRQIDTYFMPTFEDIISRVCMTDARTTQERILRVLEAHNGRMPLREVRKQVRVGKRAEFDEALDMLESQDPLHGTGEIKRVTMVNPVTQKTDVYLVMMDGYE